MFCALIRHHTRRVIEHRRNIVSLRHTQKKRCKGTPFLPVVQIFYVESFSFIASKAKNHGQKRKSFPVFLFYRRKRTIFAKEYMPETGAPWHATYSIDYLSSFARRGVEHSSYNNCVN